MQRVLNQEPFTQEEISSIRMHNFIASPEVLASIPAKDAKQKEEFITKLCFDLLNTIDGISRARARVAFVNNPPLIIKLHLSGSSQKKKQNNGKQNPDEVGAVSGTTGPLLQCDDPEVEKSTKESLNVAAFSMTIPYNALLTYEEIVVTLTHELVHSTDILFNFLIQNQASKNYKEGCRLYAGEICETSLESNSLNCEMQKPQYNSFINFLDIVKKLVTLVNDEPNPSQFKELTPEEQRINSAMRSIANSRIYHVTSYLPFTGAMLMDLQNVGIVTIDSKGFLKAEPFACYYPNLKGELTFFEGIFEDSIVYRGITRTFPSGNFRFYVPNGFPVDEKTQSLLKEKPNDWIPISTLMPHKKEDVIIQTSKFTNVMRVAALSYNSQSKTIEIKAEMQNRSDLEFLHLAYDLLHAGNSVKTYPEEQRRILEMQAHFTGILGHDGLKKIFGSQIIEKQIQRIQEIAEIQELKQQDSQIISAEDTCERDKCIIAPTTEIMSSAPQANIRTLTWVSSEDVLSQTLPQTIEPESQIDFLPQPVPKKFKELTQSWTTPLENAPGAISDQTTQISPSSRVTPPFHNIFTITKNIGEWISSSIFSKSPAPTAKSDTALATPFLDPAFEPTYDTKPTAAKDQELHPVCTDPAPLSAQIMLGQTFAHIFDLGRLTQFLPWNRCRILSEKEKLELLQHKKTLLRLTREFSQQKRSRTGTCGLFEDKFKFADKKQLLLLKDTIDQMLKIGYTTSTLLADISGRIERLQEISQQNANHNRTLKCFAIKDQRIQRRNERTGVSSITKLTLNAGEQKLTREELDPNSTRSQELFFWREVEKLSQVSKQKLLTSQQFLPFTLQEPYSPHDLAQKQQEQIVYYSNKTIT